MWNAIAILTVSILAIESTIRLGIQLDLITTPGMGTGNADLNIKIPLLDQYVKENGGINCIFLGSSMTNDAVIPEVFTRRYRELSSEEITCFNFGVSTLSGEVAGRLGKIIVDRYQPDLLIYGTSARDYSLVLGQKSLLEDAWFRYQLGEWNLAGWLKEYSMIYRYYLGFLANLNPANRVYAIEVKMNTSSMGYYFVDENKMDLEGQNIINEVELNQKDFTGLKRLAALNKSVTRVIVVEVPVHAKFLPVYVNGSSEDYQSLFFGPVKGILDNRNIPIISTNTGGRFNVPDDQWADLKHLNYVGAQKFSSWLAEQIWELEDTGSIPRIEWGN